MVQIMIQFKETVSIVQHHEILSTYLIQAQSNRA
jgi:hypothetical protein